MKPTLYLFLAVFVVTIVIVRNEARQKINRLPLKAEKLSNKISYPESSEEEAEEVTSKKLEPLKLRYRERRNRKQPIVSQSASVSHDSYDDSVSSENWSETRSESDSSNYSGVSSGSYDSGEKSRSEDSDSKARESSSSEESRNSRESGPSSRPNKRSRSKQSDSRSDSSVSESSSDSKSGSSSEGSKQSDSRSDSSVSESSLDSESRSPERSRKSESVSSESQSESSSRSSSESRSSEDSDQSPGSATDVQYDAKKSGKSYSSESEDSRSSSGSQSNSISPENDESASSSDSQTYESGEKSEWSSETSQSSQASESSEEASQRSEFSSDSSVSSEEESSVASNSNEDNQDVRSSPKDKRWPSKIDKRGKFRSPRKQKSSNADYHANDECIEVCGKNERGSDEPCECHGDKIDCNAEDFTDADICFGQSFLDKMEKKGEKFIVRTVDMNYNNIKRLDAKYVVPEHTKTIRELDLEHNLIDDIEDGSFVDFEDLRLLDLSYNKIEEVYSDMFKGLGKLETLNLRGNQISGLLDKPFRHLKSLKTLYLSDNPIGQISETSFAELNNLQILNLDNTGLRMAHEEWFTGLHNLQALSMKNNNFRILPPFHKLSSLVNLYLSGNPIADIPKRAFTGLTNLEKIELDRMPDLWFIDECAFCGLDSLLDLEMSHNKKLAMIDPKAFGSGWERPGLENLKLFNNSLKTLDKDMLEWEEIEMVDLANNEWTCDARITWIVELDVRLTRTALCKSPDLLAGQPIQELEPSEFHDAPSTSRFARFRNVARSGNGILIASAIVVSIVLLGAFIYIVVCRTRGSKVPNGMPRYAYRNLSMGTTASGPSEADDVVLVNTDSLRKMDFNDRDGFDHKHVPLPEPVNL